MQIWHLLILLATIIIERGEAFVSKRTHPTFNGLVSRGGCHSFRSLKLIKTKSSEIMQMKQQVSFLSKVYRKTTRQCSIPPGRQISLRNLTCNALPISQFQDLVASAEHPPTTLYFWYLIAAGCGFPFPEDSLVMWVGMKIANGVQKETFKTLLYIYLGVVISDWIPFFMATLVSKGVLKQSRFTTMANIKEVEGANNTKSALARAAEIIRLSGRWVGIVARFSPGLRTPLFLAAGFMRINPVKFCVGDAIGAAITLLVQLSIGSWLAAQSGPPMALLSGATAVLYGFGFSLGIGVPAIIYRLQNSNRIVGPRNQTNDASIS
mmetsp:Transcript_13555/g.18764  ORF Transcript_13555/g.18764 Transcript_13555/m.18764 type:complete len:322 (-) Transcript_13555:192-1157(-)